MLVLLYKSTTLGKNHCSKWLLLCVKLFQAFFSNYCKKSLLISISSDFYEKHLVTQNFCVSTNNSYCSLQNLKFHILLIVSSFDQILRCSLQFEMEKSGKNDKCCKEKNFALKT